MNVIQYAAANQALFNRIMTDLGYTPFTTFFYDLSIAELMKREKGIRDTHKRVMRSWMGDIKYITEYCMALNHKIWQMYAYHQGTSSCPVQMDYMALAKVYDELWKKCDAKIIEYYKDNQEALSYYYSTTD